MEEKRSDAHRGVLRGVSLHSSLFLFSFLVFSITAEPLLLLRGWARWQVDLPILKNMDNHPLI